MQRVSLGVAIELRSPFASRHRFTKAERVSVVTLVAGVVGTVRSDFALSMSFIGTVMSD